jgi:hypothetical protein
MRRSGLPGTFFTDLPVQDTAHFIRQTILQMPVPAARWLFFSRIEEKKTNCRLFLVGFLAKFRA